MPAVPQEADLVPLLFLIYINDLPISITSSLILFASDCVICQNIKSPFDRVILQSNLENISFLWETLRVKLNTTKWKFMKILRHAFDATPTVYWLSNALLTPVSSY